MRRPRKTLLLGICTQPSVLDGRRKQQQRERLRGRPSGARASSQLGLESALNRGQEFKGSKMQAVPD